MTSRKGPVRQSVAEMQRQTELQAKRGGSAVGRRALQERNDRAQWAKRREQTARDISAVLNAAATAEEIEGAQLAEFELEERQRTTREKLIKAGVITKPVRDARQVAGLSLTKPSRGYVFELIDEVDRYPGAPVLLGENPEDEQANTYAGAPARF